MRTPIRKGGKYVHLRPDPNMTTTKYQELQEKLKKYKTRRPVLAEEVKRLALMGDFSENAAYQIAKGQLRGLNQRILDAEDLLKRAQIIEEPQNDGTIQLGSTVTIEVNGKQTSYKILGSTETNPDAGIISHNSPLGADLIGRRVGDIIKRKTPGGVKEYKVLKIE